MVQVGDNSDAPGGIHEFKLTRSPDLGQRMWVSSLINGFDSGIVTVSCNVRAGTQTNASWWVEGSTIYSDASFAAVNSVEIIARAKNGGKMTWSHITVTFYKNGHVTETITIPDECVPIADPITQVLQIVPTADDNTGVLIEAEVRLEHPGTTLPAPDEMTGTIGIFTD